jgi:hypothetical protein
MIGTSEFTDPDGNWLDPDQWPTVQASVTCHTSGCAVEGVPFEVELGKNVDGVLRCVCGHCEKAVTDIRPVA